MQTLLAQLVACPIGWQPLQQLGQLSNLADECQQDRLRVLELLPFPLGDEGARGIPDLSQVRHIREYAPSLAAGPSDS